jgi:hypothetical protein
MSLLKKASIITTPTAYAEDYLYSIKPAIPYGEELVVNGNFHNNVDSWSNGNSGVNTWVNGHLVCTGDGGSYAAARQVIPAVENRKYIVTAQIARVSGSFQVGIEVNDFNGSGWNVIGSKTTSSEFVTVSEVITTNTGTTQLDLRATIFNTTVDNTNSLKLDNVSVKLLTDADFDFDRNSTGTRVNEDYLIEDVPYNLLTYSEEIKSTNSWIIQSGVTVTNNDVLAPNGTFTADKLVGNGTVGVFKQVTNLDGVVTRSVYLKSVTGNVSVIIKDPILTQTQKTLNLNETWQRYTLTEDNLSANNIQGIWIDDIPASGIYMWGAQVVKGDQPKDYLKTTDRLDIPRIDYTNGEPSILLEPSRTNQSLHSNDISQLSTIKNGSATITTTGNYAKSPDGTNTATRIVATTTSSEYAVVTSTAATSTSGNYVGSVWLKSNNGQTQNVAAYTRNATVSYVTIYPYWQRYEVSGSAATNFFNIGSRVSVGSDASVDFLAWGMQIEHGSYATSLIHTSGSAVTRSADRADNAGNSDLINSTEGVFYLQFAALTGAGSFNDLSLSDGTQNNKVQLFYRATDKINARVTVGGVNVFDHIYQSTDTTQFEKVAIKWKLNDFSMYVDGREVDSDSSGATFSANTLNVVKINDNNISDYEGKIKCLAVFKEALTDLELEKLTGYNNHELYMNYYNRLSYLGLVEEYNVESDINNYIL